MKDAEEYFENNLRQYHKFENHSYLSELWEWFEDYSDKNNFDSAWEVTFLSHWECHQGNYDTEIEIIYAKKLIALPYEYIL